MKPIVVKQIGSVGGTRTNYLKYKKLNEIEGSSRGLFNEDSLSLTESEAVGWTEVTSAGREVDGRFEVVVSLGTEADFELLGENSEDRLEAFRNSIRLGMKSLASQVGIVNLKWYAAIHRNTDNPHCHIVIAKEGVGIHGQPVPIERFPPGWFVSGKGRESLAGQAFKNALMEIRPEVRVGTSEPETTVVEVKRGKRLAFVDASLNFETQPNKVGIAKLREDGFDLIFITRDGSTAEDVQKKIAPVAIESDRVVGIESEEDEARIPENEKFLNTVIEAVSSNEADESEAVAVGFDHESRTMFRSIGLQWKAFENFAKRWRPALATVEDFPPYLGSLPQWVVWGGWVREGKKPKKMPVSVLNEKGAKSNDPNTWSTLKRVEEFIGRKSTIRLWDPATKTTQNQKPAGFLFALREGDGVAGIDLDDCRNPETGKLTPEAEEIVARFAGTYMEVSPSGKGIRIFGFGTPGATGTNVDRENKWIELYDYRSPRFLSVTGNRLPQSTSDLQPIQASLDWLYTQHFKKQESPERKTNFTRRLNETSGQSVLSDYEFARECLREIGAWRAKEYRTWFLACVVLKANLGEQGYHLFLDWTLQGGKYPEHEAQYTWKKSNPKSSGNGLGLLVNWIREDGGTVPQRFNKEKKDGFQTGHRGLERTGASLASGKSAETVRENRIEQKRVDQSGGEPGEQRPDDLRVDGHGGQRGLGGVSGGVGDGELPGGAGPGGRGGEDAGGFRGDADQGLAVNRDPHLSEPASGAEEAQSEIAERTTAGDSRDAWEMSLDEFLKLTDRVSVVDRDTVYTTENVKSVYVGNRVTAETILRCQHYKEVRERLSQGLEVTVEARQTYRFEEVGVPGAVFVFGSNLAGIHGNGAAYFARHIHGAEIGVGEGRTGNTYAIPTKNEKLQSLPLTKIGEHIQRFLEYAETSSEIFEISRIGTGLAGYADQEIAPFFKAAPPNCVLPKEWGEMLGRELAESDEARDSFVSVKTENGSGKEKETKSGRTNYHIPDDYKQTRGAKARFGDLIEAIDTLHRIRARKIEGGDPLATLKEKEKLVRFPGWGSFPPGLYNNVNEAGKDWTKERERLMAALSSEEWDAACRATINAHYTSEEIVDAMYQMAVKLGLNEDQLGFEPRILEPALGGRGVFFGRIPEQLRNSRLMGIELDRVSAEIAALLYPEAVVRQGSFGEETLPLGSFDLVITNVPFSKGSMFDPYLEKFEPAVAREALHDQFLVKSVLAARPGGLVLAITSAYSMDKVKSVTRDWLAANTELVGAFRLPAGTFEENANTRVITDILILKKNVNGPVVGLAEYEWQVVEKLADDPLSPYVNEYFLNNPEKVLGKLEVGRGLYENNSMVVTNEGPDDLRKRLENAIESLPENIVTLKEVTFRRVNYSPKSVRTNGLYVDQGEIFKKTPFDGGIKVNEFGYYSRTGEPKFLPLTDAIRGRAISLIELRDTVRSLLNAETEGGETVELRSRLNREYDLFVSRHGYLNAEVNHQILHGDPDGKLLFAIERKKPKSKKTKESGEKTEIFTRSVAVSRELRETVNSMEEALLVSKNEYGMLNLDYVAKLLRITPEQAGKELIETKLGFFTPGRRWEAAGEYLSGNVRTKLAEAALAAELDQRFQLNVDALREVIPPDIEAEDIAVPLGSAWVPVSDYKQFFCEIAGLAPEEVSISYAAPLGRFSLNFRKIFAAEHLMEQTYGTSRMDFEKIAEHALNRITARITDKIDEKEVVNPEATSAANEKIRNLQTTFSNWIWSGLINETGEKVATEEQVSERRTRLGKLYNELFNNYVPQEFVGKGLTFPGMNNRVVLKEWQRRAVERAMSGGVCLAHAVGAGKTFEGIAAGMKLKQIGIVGKSLIVCPKSVIGQWTRDIEMLYPGARVLSTNGHFEREEREYTIARMVTEEADFIVITYDQLRLLPMRPETRQRFLQREVEAITKIAYAESKKEGNVDNRFVKMLAKRIENYESKIKQIGEEREGKKDTGAYLEDLIGNKNIAIIYDEFHKCKNIPHGDMTAALRGKKGIPQSNSQIAADVLMLNQWLAEQNALFGSDHRIIGLTGTPITNTVIEAYNLAKHFSALPAECDNITAFLTQFVQFNGRTERTARGYEIVERPGGFKNLPELSRMLSKFVDIQFLENIPGIERPTASVEVVLCPQSEELERYQDNLVQRAVALKGKRVEKGADNILKIYHLLNSAAIDLRLVREDAERHGIVVGDYEQSKVNACVESAVGFFRESEKNGTPKTQLIFTNTGIHPNDDGFSVTEDLIRKLEKGGIPRDRIVNFSGLSENQRKIAQERLNTGDAVIGIGSTETLGTGVNVQRLLGFLHHLDIPYLPSDVEQRNGRGIRQGNTNKNIGIAYYLTERADEFRLGLLTTKQGFIRQFIEQIKRGTFWKREIVERNPENFSAEQMAALASGNPEMLRKFELQEEVETLERSYRNFQRGMERMHWTINETQRKVESLKGQLLTTLETIKKRDQNTTKEFRFSLKKGERLVDLNSRRSAGEAVLLRGYEITKRFQDSYQDIEVGFYKGFTIVSRSSGMDASYRTFVLKAGFKNYELAFNNEKPESIFASADAYLRNLEGLVQAIEFEVQEKEAAITQLIPKLTEEALDPVTGQSERRERQFPNLQKLEELRDDLHDIDAKLLQDAVLEAKEKELRPREIKIFRFQNESGDPEAKPQSLSNDSSSHIAQIEVELPIENVGKQAWELSREMLLDVMLHRGDYAIKGDTPEAFRKEISKQFELAKSGLGLTIGFDHDLDESALAVAHFDCVTKALQDGRTLPEEVNEDYPDPRSPLVEARTVAPVFIEAVWNAGSEILTPMAGNFQARDFFRLSFQKPMEGRDRILELENGVGRAEAGSALEGKAVHNLKVGRAIFAEALRMRRYFVEMIADRELPWFLRDQVEQPERNVLNRFLEGPKGYESVLPEWTDVTAGLSVSEEMRETEEELIANSPVGIPSTEHPEAGQVGLFEGLGIPVVETPFIPDGVTDFELSARSAGDDNDSDELGREETGFSSELFEIIPDHASKVFEVVQGFQGREIELIAFHPEPVAPMLVETAGYIQKIVKQRQGGAITLFGGQRDSLDWSLGKERGLIGKVVFIDAPRGFEHDLQAIVSETLQFHPDQEKSIAIVAANFGEELQVMSDGSVVASPGLTEFFNSFGTGKEEKGDARPGLEIVFVGMELSSTGALKKALKPYALIGSERTYGSLNEYKDSKANNVGTFFEVGIESLENEGEIYRIGFVQRVITDDLKEIVEKNAEDLKTRFGQNVDLKFGYAGNDPMYLVELEGQPKWGIGFTGRVFSEISKEMIFADFRETVEFKNREEERAVEARMEQPLDIAGEEKAVVTRPRLTDELREKLLDYGRGKNHLYEVSIENELGQKAFAGFIEIPKTVRMGSDQFERKWSSSVRNLISSTALSPLFPNMEKNITAFESYRENRLQSTVHTLFHTWTLAYTGRTKDMVMTGKPLPTIDELLTRLEPVEVAISIGRKKSDGTYLMEDQRRGGYVTKIDRLSVFSTLFTEEFGKEAVAFLGDKWNSKLGSELECDWSSVRKRVDLKNAFWVVGDERGLLVSLTGRTQQQAIEEGELQPVEFPRFNLLESLAAEFENDGAEEISYRDQAPSSELGEERVSEPVVEESEREIFEIVARKPEGDTQLLLGYCGIDDVKKIVSQKASLLYLLSLDPNAELTSNGGDSFTLGMGGQDPWVIEIARLRGAFVTRQKAIDRGERQTVERFIEERERRGSKVEERHAIVEVIRRADEIGVEGEIPQEEARKVETAVAEFKAEDGVIIQNLKNVKPELRMLNQVIQYGIDRSNAALDLTRQKYLKALIVEASREFVETNEGRHEIRLLAELNSLDDDDPIRRKAAERVICGNYLAQTKREFNRPGDKEVLIKNLPVGGEKPITLLLGYLPEPTVDQIRDLMLDRIEVLRELIGTSTPPPVRSTRGTEIIGFGRDDKYFRAVVSGVTRSEAGANGTFKDVAEYVLEMKREKERQVQERIAEIAAEGRRKEDVERSRETAMLMVMAGDLEQSANIFLVENAVRDNLKTRYKGIPREFRQDPSNARSRLDVLNGWIELQGKMAKITGKLAEKRFAEIATATAIPEFGSRAAIRFSTEAASRSVKLILFDGEAPRSPEIVDSRLAYVEGLIDRDWVRNGETLIRVSGRTPKPRQIVKSVARDAQTFQEMWLNQPSLDSFKAKLEADLRITKTDESEIAPMESHGLALEVIESPTANPEDRKAETDLNETKSQRDVIGEAVGVFESQNPDLDALRKKKLIELFQRDAETPVGKDQREYLEKKLGAMPNFIGSRLEAGLYVLELTPAEKKNAVSRNFVNSYLARLEELKLKEIPKGAILAVERIELPGVQEARQYKTLIDRIDRLGLDEGRKKFTFEERQLVGILLTEHDGACLMPAGTPDALRDFMKTEKSQQMLAEKGLVVVESDSRLSIRLKLVEVGALSEKQAFNPYLKAVADYSLKPGTRSGFPVDRPEPGQPDGIVFRLNRPDLEAKGTTNYRVVLIEGVNLLELRNDSTVSREYAELAATATTQGRKLRDFVEGKGFDGVETQNSIVLFNRERVITLLETTEPEKAYEALKDEKPSHLVVQVERMTRGELFLSEQRELIAKQGLERWLAAGRPVVAVDDSNNPISLQGIEAICREISKQDAYQQVREGVVSPEGYSQALQRNFMERLDGFSPAVTALLHFASEVEDAKRSEVERNEGVTRGLRNTESNIPRSEEEGVLFEEKRFEKGLLEAARAENPQALKNFAKFLQEPNRESIGIPETLSSEILERLVAEAELADMGRTAAKAQLENFKRDRLFVAHELPEETLNRFSDQTGLPVQKTWTLEEISSRTIEFEKRILKGVDQKGGNDDDREQLAILEEMHGQWLKLDEARRQTHEVDLKLATEKSETLKEILQLEGQREELPNNPLLSRAEMERLRALMRHSGYEPGIVGLWERKIDSTLEDWKGIEETILKKYGAYAEQAGINLKESPDVVWFLNRASTEEAPFKIKQYLSNKGVTTEKMPSNRLDAAILIEKEGWGFEKGGFLRRAVESGAHVAPEYLNDSPVPTLSSVRTEAFASHVIYRAVDSQLKFRGMPVVPLVSGADALQKIALERVFNITRSGDPRKSMLTGISETLRLAEANLELVSEEKKNERLTKAIAYIKEHAEKELSGEHKAEIDFGKVAAQAVQIGGRIQRGENLTPVSVNYGGREHALSMSIGEQVGLDVSAMLQSVRDSRNALAERGSRAKETSERLKKKMQVIETEVPAVRQGIVMGPDEAIEIQALSLGINNPTTLKQIVERFEQARLVPNPEQGIAHISLSTNLTAQIQHQAELAREGFEAQNREARLVEELERRFQPLETTVPSLSASREPNFAAAAPQPSRTEPDSLRR